MKIKSIVEIPIPKGITIVRNDEYFITLAKINRRTGLVGLFTCETSEVLNKDLTNNSTWMTFSEDEIKMITKLLK